MKRILSLCCLSTAAAFGQSFNVDLNATSGAGSGASTSTFKGAAGQAGTWNAVGGTTPVALANTSGGATSVMLSRSPFNSGTIVNNSSGALSGDDEKLLEDGFQGNTGVTVTYQFSSLGAGTYALYTYAIDPASPIVSLVNVAGSTSQSDQNVGTILGGPGYFVGATHSLHVATVPAGGSLSVTIAPPVPGQGVNIAGFQLVALPAPLLRIYVDDGAAGAGLGSSWADAFTHPVTALSTARVAGGQNCEVWVANGFYEPTLGSERFRSFDIPNHLKFYGGFTGTETDLGQRHPGSALTYLNGNIGDNAVPWDNSYTVVDASQTAADTLIDGFRIHNGRNDDGGPVGGLGAGMLLQNSSATVRNCTFVENWSAEAGAGVYSSLGSPTFVYCLFYQNHAGNAGTGGGIYHSGTGMLRMYNCRFLRNFANEGAGAYFDEADGTLAGCVFDGNVAWYNGGGINAHGAASSVNMSNCTLVGNEGHHYTGGAFANGGASLGINNSVFWDNIGFASTTTLEEQYDVMDGGLPSVFFTTAQGAAGAQGADPLFVDGNGADGNYGTFDDNLRLAETSPCIDAGMASVIGADLGDVDGDGDTAEAIPADFDGELRRVDDPDTADTGFGPPPMVDRGAFEFQPCVIEADINDDGQVDLRDLTILLSNFGTASGSDFGHGDIDGDGDVDLSDLATLLANFGSACE